MDNKYNSRQAQGTHHGPGQAGMETFDPPLLLANFNCNCNMCVSLKKILHTGNTRPSHTFFIQEHRFYTMTLSQYHWGCQYPDSMSIP